VGELLTLLGGIAGTVAVHVFLVPDLTAVVPATAISAAADGRKGKGMERE